MILIALRNLLQEKTRLVIGVLGVLFAVFLMATLIGLYNGSSRQFTQVIDNNPADVFVAGKDVSEFFHGQSSIPTTKIDELKAEPEVKAVVPVIIQHAPVKQDDRTYDVFLSSFEKDQPEGMPWQVISGTTNLDKQEIILTKSLGDKLSKTVGDKLELAGETFTIAGITEGEPSFGTYYAWITLDKAKAMTKQTETVQFAYISVHAPASTPHIVNDLKSRYPDLSIFTKAGFTENNRAVLLGSFLPVMQALVVIACLIGIAVIGLNIYTATLDKAREYGILKALGLRNRQLYGIVFMQALITTLLGLVVGLAMFALVANSLGQLIDIMPILYGVNVAMIVSLVVVMGVIASFIPVRRLVRIDPVEVFK
jgi:putative ABC transport system permease protein